MATLQEKCSAKQPSNTKYDPSVDGVLNQNVFGLGHCNINLVKNSGYQTRETPELVLCVVDTPETLQ